MAANASSTRRGTHGVLSLCLSSLDRLGILFNKYKKIRFFADGLGDTRLFQRTNELFCRQFVQRHARLHPLDLQTGLRLIPLSASASTSSASSSSTAAVPISIFRTSFLSPVAAYLPNEESIRQVDIEVVYPGVAKSLDDILRSEKSIVFQFPGTSDEGFQLRRNYLAKPLATEYDVTSILLQLPYHGHRRLLSNKRSAALNKVEYLFTQSVAGVMETIALIRYLREDKEFKGKICITGMSFGGLMAALSTIFIPFSVAAVSLGGACGPHAAFCEGILTSLTDGSPENFKEISKTLFAFNIENVVEYDNLRYSGEESKSVEKVYLQISAWDDMYIPLPSAKRLYDAMTKLQYVTHSEFHGLAGGHLSMMFNRKMYFETIHRALSKLS